MGKTDRPANYDKSLDGLTPNWKDKMPDPGLDAKKDFGSATEDVLKESRKVMPKILGTSAQHGDMTHRSPVDKGVSFAGGFSAKQTPTTAPNPRVIGSRVTSRRVTDASKSVILHGNPSQKKL